MKMKIEDEGDCSQITFIPENRSELYMCRWLKTQMMFDIEEKQVCWGIDESQIKPDKLSIEEARRIADIEITKK